MGAINRPLYTHTHTRVGYTSEGIKSHATIADSLRHDETDVWTHTEPVLKDIKQRIPSLTTTHFMSEGPVTQYRNKKKLYLLTTLPSIMGIKKKRITWNISEKAHGKGAPDGVGGAVKRTADEKVKTGADVQTPEDLFDATRSTSSNVKRFWIPEEDILRHDEAVPAKLPVIKGNHENTADCGVSPLGRSDTVS